jgi:hypothetical protein
MRLSSPVRASHLPTILDLPTLPIAPPWLPSFLAHVLRVQRQFELYLRAFWGLIHARHELAFLGLT